MERQDGSKGALAKPSSGPTAPATIDAKTTATTVLKQKQQRRMRSVSHGQKTHGITGNAGFEEECIERDCSQPILQHLEAATESITDKTEIGGRTSLQRLVKVRTVSPGQKISGPTILQPAEAGTESITNNTEIRARTSLELLMDHMVESYEVSYQASYEVALTGKPIASPISHRETGQHSGTSLQAASEETEDRTQIISEVSEDSGFQEEEDNESPARTSKVVSFPDSPVTTKELFGENRFTLMSEEEIIQQTLEDLRLIRKLGLEGAAAVKRTKEALRETWGGGAAC